MQQNPASPIGMHGMARRNGPRARTLSGSNLSAKLARFNLNAPVRYFEHVDLKQTILMTNEMKPN